MRICPGVRNDFARLGRILTFFGELHPVCLRICRKKTLFDKLSELTSPSVLRTFLPVVSNTDQLVHGGC